METDEAIVRVQDRLAGEGGSMGELLGHFRNMIPPVLIGDREWERVLECADRLPITMGAFPFGFELPLHERNPEADLGVSLTSGTEAARFFEQRARADGTDGTAGALVRLFERMDAEVSPLREIVGRKVMLEYDIGRSLPHRVPGLFLRPGERPIVGAGGQQNDVGTVADALVASVGWEMTAGERENVERAYVMQPADTRMDSFGIFPSRSRALRLAVMGFRSRHDLGSYLEGIGWPGDVRAVESVIERFRERANIVRSGTSIDVLEDGVGPTLGLTLIVRQRYTKDSRYWLDGLTDWDPFLDALRLEDIVVQEKLDALGNWVARPSLLFGKSGRYVMLRGIHHIKLVMSGDRLRQAKAYIFIVLSGAALP